MMTFDPDGDSDAVAVIGMAARFPGAADVGQYWRNLLAGVDTTSIHPAPDDPTTGVVGGVLDGADEFDNRFFGFSPREALITDPQHRVLLECAYHALEDVGHDPGDPETTVGMFAGGSTTRYASVLRDRIHELPYTDDMQIRIATGPDFLATRVAYKLGLTGPAVSVCSAEAASLVTIHSAMQSLLAGECDMALAGGVSVGPRVSRRDDVTPGSGVGVLVLSRLADVRDTGARIRAVIGGSAVNNDGGSRPSAERRARVIRTAWSVAGIADEGVGHVETHAASGTPDGDPVELEALTIARAGDGANAQCWLGSVKPNIGDADTAAGIAGVIKAVLAVEHGVIPPSLRSASDESRIGDVLRINTELVDWNPTGVPRRAGISAFGADGTNAHVVVEQAPARPKTARAEGWQLLPLSAKDDAALDAMSAELGEHLDAHTDVELADVAWTLQTGRIAHRRRRFLVTENRDDAARALSGRSRRRLFTGVTPQRTDPVVLTFPGQGGQHVGMTADLYRTCPDFRSDIDECSSLAAVELGVDLRSVLYPEGEAAVAEAGRAMATIEIGQPAIFVVEYALARLLRRAGVRPSAVTGHSLGAYAAACTAGVFSLKDALSVVVKRGKLLHTLPSGSMAAVGLPERDVLDLLPPGLDIGAVNGPGQTTVSGPTDLIDRFVHDFPRQDVEIKKLKIDSAGHSSLVNPVLDEFEQFVASVTLHEPSIPVASDTTGTWADPADLATPSYWRNHMRQAVRFSGVLTALAESRRSLVEVGPGMTLTALARKHPAVADDVLTVQSLPHPADPAPELSVLLAALGKLWLTGVDVDWSALRDEYRGERIELPGYPFQRQPFVMGA